MTYLRDALSALGIYFTPPHVTLAIQPQEAIVANPPFITYRTITRAYDAICSRCLGSLCVPTKHGVVACPECRATGNITRYVNEIVAVEVDADANKR